MSKVSHQHQEFVDKLLSEQAQQELIANESVAKVIAEEDDSIGIDLEEARRESERNARRFLQRRQSLEEESRRRHYRHQQQTDSLTHDRIELQDMHLSAFEPASDAQSDEHVKFDDEHNHSVRFADELNSSSVQQQQQQQDTDYLAMWLDDKEQWEREKRAGDSSMAPQASQASADNGDLITELDSELASTMAHLDANRRAEMKRVGQLQSQIDKLNLLNQSLSLDPDVKAQNRLLSEVTSDKIQLERRAHRAEAELEALKAAQLRDTHRHHSQQETMDHTDTELRALHDVNRALTSQLEHNETSWHVTQKRLEAKARQLDRDNFQLQTDLQSERDLSSSRLSEVKRLRVALSAEEKERDLSLERERETLQMTHRLECNKLRQQIDDLAFQLQQAQAKLDTSSLSVLRASTNSSGDLDSTSQFRQIAELRSQVTTLKQERDGLVAQFEASSSLSETVELDRVRSQLAESKRMHQETRQRLEQECERLRDDARTSSSRNAVVDEARERQFKVLEEQLRLARQQNAQLSSQLSRALTNKLSGVGRQSVRSDFSWDVSFANQEDQQEQDQHDQEDHDHQSDQAESESEPVVVQLEEIRNNQNGGETDDQADVTSDEMHRLEGELHSIRQQQQQEVVSDEVKRALAAQEERILDQLNTLKSSYKHLAHKYSNMKDRYLKQQLRTNALQQHLVSIQQQQFVDLAIQSSKSSSTQPSSSKSQAAVSVSADRDDDASDDDGHDDDDDDDDDGGDLSARYPPDDGLMQKHRRQTDQENSTDKVAPKQHKKKRTRVAKPTGTWTKRRISSKKSSKKVAVSTRRKPDSSASSSVLRHTSRPRTATTIVGTNSSTRRSSPVVQPRSSSAQRPNRRNSKVSATKLHRRTHSAQTQTVLPRPKKTSSQSWR